MDVIAQMFCKYSSVLEGNKIRISIHSSIYLFRGNIERIYIEESKMAHGLSDNDMKKEYFDPQQHLDEKLDKLAEWIRKSKHFIVFTGRFEQDNYGSSKSLNLSLS